MISADNVRIYALGVMPNVFGNEEMKTAALPCLVGGDVFRCLLVNAIQGELKAGDITVQWTADEWRYANFLFWTANSSRDDQSKPKLSMAWLPRFDV